MAAPSYSSGPSVWQTPGSSGGRYGRTYDPSHDWLGGVFHRGPVTYKPAGTTAKKSGLATMSASRKSRRSLTR